MVRGGANLETTVGVLIACAAEREATWDDLLSIRGIGSVLRLVGQVCELMAECLCDMSLWVWLFWPIHPVADTEGKKTRQSAWNHLPSLFLLTLKTLSRNFVHLRWAARRICGPSNVE